MFIFNSIKIKTILLLIFFTVIIVHVLANTFYLSGIVSRGIIGKFIYLYYIKHFIIFLLSLFLLINLGLKLKIKIYNEVLLLFLAFIPYIFINYSIVYIQFIIFITACIFISYVFNSHLNKIYLSLILLIILIPLVIDYFYNNSSAISNHFYGERPRLLLGYFHPKEAGNAFLIFFILVNLYFLHQLSIYKRISFHLVFIIILYYIQSRNSLLFYLNMLIFNFSLKKFGTKFTLIMIFIGYICLPFYLSIFFFKKINLLLSKRLDVWGGAINFNWFGNMGNYFIKTYDKLYTTKFHVDNYYLEFLIESGMFFFIIFIFALFLIIKKINLYQKNGIYINSIFLSFLIFCFFDAGMFSTGNLLNIFIWSLVFYALREIRKNSQLYIK